MGSDSSMLKVSVVIPVFNAEIYIEECVNSVLNQTHENIEIILVDDCSNDQSLSKITELSRRHQDKIKVYHIDTNSGPSNARNYGIEQTTGQYISFLDADDYWLPNKLEKQLNGIITQNSNLSFTDIDVICNKKVEYTRRHLYRKYDYNTLLKTNFIPHSTLIIKKELVAEIKYKTVQSNSRLINWLLKLNLTNCLIHEDYAFLLELYRMNNVRSSYVPEPLVVYRTHDTNLSRSYAKKLVSLFFIYKNQEQYSFIISLLYTIRISFFALLKNKTIFRWLLCFKNINIKIIYIYFRLFYFLKG